MLKGLLRSFSEAIRPIAACDEILSYPQGKKLGLLCQFIEV